MFIEYMTIRMIFLCVPFHSLSEHETRIFIYFHRIFILFTGLSARLLFCAKIWRKSYFHFSALLRSNGGYIRNVRAMEYRMTLYLEEFASWLHQSLQYFSINCSLMRCMRNSQIARGFIRFWIVPACTTNTTNHNSKNDRKRYKFCLFNDRWWYNIHMSRFRRWSSIERINGNIDVLLLLRLWCYPTHPRRSTKFKFT